MIWFSSSPITTPTTDTRHWSAENLGVKYAGLTTQCQEECLRTRSKIGLIKGNYIMRMKRFSCGEYTSGLIVIEREMFLIVFNMMTPYTYH